MRAYFYILMPQNIIHFVAWLAVVLGTGVEIFAAANYPAKANLTALGLALFGIAAICFLL